jgi:hypothetical protein
MSKTISETVREDLRLAVDENNLLEEWRAQGAMMLDYGIQLADARQKEDEAKAALSVVVAELDCNIRAEPAEYGLPKATETSVVNAIPGCGQHQHATKALTATRHTARVLGAAVDALDHRKRTLQGMTDLFLRQWYADPTKPGQPKELAEAVEDAPTKKIPGRRTRKPRRTT